MEKKQSKSKWQRQSSTNLSFNAHKSYLKSQPKFINIVCRQAVEEMRGVGRQGGEAAGRAAAHLRVGPSFHDGPVDDGLDVVLPVAGVDDALPLGVLLDVALLEELEAHVRRHRLRTGRNSRTVS